MKTWWINTLTFLGMLARIFEFLFIRPIKHLLPQNLLNKWIHLISYRIKTYSNCFKQDYFDRLTKLTGENAEAILRRDKEK